MTSTQRFGSSKREAHDASAFYERFTGPELSTDSDLVRQTVVDTVICGDARTMAQSVAEGSVALVVTSPPYFAGKEYEETLGENGVPGSYFEYLELLHEVFAACKTALEPGGRIAVNVANLGRRPYRSLSADVIGILQDLGLLLRGEVIWWKGRAAGGSCAWGSFQRPANPVLRDVTERVIIAGKGRFDRAGTPKQRLADDHPSTSTISRDEFLEATTDLWEIPPASATRVGHPAPFPVELPQRLIELYTYRGDLVLDPFMGAGTTGVAAVRTGRHYIGFDTDEGYVARAEELIEAERGRLADSGAGPIRVELPALKQPAPDPDADLDAALARLVGEGRQASAVAEELLSVVGFVDVRSGVKVRGVGVEVDLVATDRTGREWSFLVSGGFTTTRSGLRQTDTLWRSIATASVLQHADERPVILLTTEVPPPKSTAAKALASVTGPGLPVFDVVRILDPDDQGRLRRYAQSGP